MATFKPMTREEQVMLYHILEPNSTDPVPEKFGPGISVYDNDRWIVGIFFINDTSNVIVGGCNPEIQGSGIWIQYWPQMVEWAHTYYDEWYTEHSTEELGDLMMKLGGIKKEYFELNQTQWNKVTFRKE